MKLTILDKDFNIISELDVDDDKIEFVDDNPQQPVSIEIPVETTVELVSISGKFFWSLWTWLFNRN